jgi:hypothetical protein
MDVCGLPRQGKKTRGLYPETLEMTSIAVECERRFTDEGGDHSMDTADKALIET